MLPKDQPYLIGETAFHHEGDIEFLLKLIEAGIESKVDAIKFHLLFDLNDYMIKDHEAIKVLEKIIIPQDKWDLILSKVNKANIDLILLCNDVKSMKWVNANQDIYKIAAIEIHATGINDLFLLKEAVKFNGTVILGIGGCTLDEIQYAVDFLKANDKRDLFLMHGFQSYPTDFTEINFKRLELLKAAFDLPVGYADHTDPTNKNANFISILPQVIGVNILEKHFTHLYGEKRIDAQAAVSLEDLKSIKEMMRIAYSTMGSENFSLSNAEKKYGDVGPMKKAIVARKDIDEGSILKIEDLAFKRTNVSAQIQQKEILNLLGSKVLKKINKDEIINLSMIEYKFTPGAFTQFFLKK